MSHFLVSINLTFKARHSLLIDELKCFIVCQFRLVQQKKNCSHALGQENLTTH